MESVMDKNAIHVMNDLVDAVEKLTAIVRDINPGAVNTYDFIDFVLVRANRVLRESHEALERA